MHAKELEFMASNGVRQLGEPRIGIFSNRQRPDSFHHAVNNWQHVLNLIYQQSVRQNYSKSFIDNLMRPVKSGSCGLLYATSNIREHYACKSSNIIRLPIVLLVNRLSN